MFFISQGIVSGDICIGIDMDRHKATLLAALELSWASCTISGLTLTKASTA